MNRKTKIVSMAMMAAAAVLISGCASTLTLLSPARSEVVLSDKRAGDVQKYEYRYALGSNRIILQRTPLCSEVARSVRVEQKRQIGYGPALLEMPFFGLGLVDMASARGISEASRKTYPLGEVETGRLLTCGAPEPAAGETLVIENPARNLRFTAVTDRNGVVNLEPLLGDTDRAVDLTVRVESDAALTFRVMYDAPVYSLSGQRPVAEN